MTKSCSRCRRIKSVEEFHAKARDPDGSIRLYQSRCKACQREMQRVAGGYRERRPIRTKRQDRAIRRRRRQERMKRLRTFTYRIRRAGEGHSTVYWREVNGRCRQRTMPRAEVGPFVQRMKAERRRELGAFREHVRVKEKLRRERAGAAMYPPRRQWGDGRKVAGAWAPPSSQETVDPAPFLAYLAYRFPTWDLEELARLMGISSRRMRDWAHGDRAELDAVDRALTRGLGRPDLLNVLYPVELEDAA